MKFIKKLIVTALLFVFVLTVSDFSAISNPVMAQAAAIKINKKALSMDVDEIVTLTVTGSKKSVKWSSSNILVATITQKGTVKGITDGKAVITAKVAGKKLTCKVTVTNTLVKEAPFKAKEVMVEDMHIIMPSDWDAPSEKNTSGDLDSGLNLSLSSNDSSKSIGSMIFTITKLSDEDKETYSNYDEFKKMCSSLLSEESLKSSILDKGELDTKITKFEQTDMETSNGKAYRINIKLDASSIPLTYIVYSFIVDDYSIMMLTIDSEVLNQKISMETIGDYVVKTISVK